MMAKQITNDKFAKAQKQYGEMIRMSTTKDRICGESTHDVSVSATAEPRGKTSATLPGQGGEEKRHDAASEEAATRYSTNSGSGS
jgi:hypothetical protein